MYCGHAVAVIVFSCTLAFHCNLCDKLNIHYSLFFLLPGERREIQHTNILLNVSCFCFSHRLTPSDARTVSVVMHGTWSGATPLLIMVLLRLAQGQEVPLVPGKTYHISLHWHVFSSVPKTSWFASIIIVCHCVSVSLCDCLTISSWHPVTIALMIYFCNVPLNLIMWGVWHQNGNIVLSTYQQFLSCTDLQSLTKAFVRQLTSHMCSCTVVQYNELHSSQLCSSQPLLIG